MAPRRVIAPLATLAAALLLGPQDAATFDTKGYPAGMVEAARLTERRCTKCHSLTRVLDAPLAAADWTDVVDDMAKKEKSGISAREAATIAGFLAFRSNRGAGGAASRGSSKDAPASRPAVFGGSAAYPPPASAVFASAPLPATASLPATLELAGARVVVREAAAQSGPDGLTRATARVTIDELEGDLDLALTDGKFSAAWITIRSWSIGPYPFSLLLALYQADPASPGAARGDFVLALLVVRGK
jgi:hypothetical protein